MQQPAKYLHVRFLQLQTVILLHPGIGPNTCVYIKTLLITVAHHGLLQGNKHKQISDRLRDAQSKRWILKAEVELVNQKRDARIAEIGALQLQFEVQSHASKWKYVHAHWLSHMLTDCVCFKGLAAEALAAAAGEAAADGEAEKHHSQPALLWVAHSHCPLLQPLPHLHCPP